VKLIERIKQPTKPLPTVYLQPEGLSLHEKVANALGIPLGHILSMSVDFEPGMPPKVTVEMHLPNVNL